MMKLLKFPQDKEWTECKQRALVTIGKDVNSNPITPPDMQWRERILMARHSPIRCLWFSFYMEIPYFVSVHLCRHVHAQPYVRSQRNDRQKDYDRETAPQNAPVSMIWDMNADELIEIAHKRLCNKADPKTQEIVQEMVNLVNSVCPEFSKVLKPACEAQGNFCKEMFPCGLYPYYGNVEGL